MSKSLLHRLFGFGRAPKALRAELESEGLVLLDEGLWVSIVYRRYRSPRAYFGWKHTGILGFLALSERRLVGSAYSRDYVNLPFDLLTPDNVRYELRGPECLEVSFDAADFHGDRSGTVRGRYHTPLARLFWERLEREVRR